MTKKDYELIAESVRRSIRVQDWSEKNKVRAQGNRDMARLIANDLAGSLYGDNPRFDRDKFIIACGITD